MGDKVSRTRLELVSNQAQITRPAGRRSLTNAAEKTTRIIDRELPMTNATNEKKELISEKLSSNAASLVDRLLQENQDLRLLAARLDSERLQLHAQIVLLRRELEIFDRERQSLDRRLSEMSSATPEGDQRLRDLMRQSALLTEIHRIALRMHGTTDRVRIFEAMEMAVEKLAGSKEVIVFEADRDEMVLRLVHSNGIDATRLKLIQFGKGVIGRVASTGDPFFEGRSKMNGLSVDEHDLGICIPVKIDDRVVGAVAVFASDPTIIGSDAMQDELYEIFARHTSSALFRSSQQS